MSLALDARQRAMLAEMGLRVFSPLAESPAEPAAVPAPRPLASKPVEAKPVEAQAEALLARMQVTGVDAMGWEALAESVAGCRACKLCEGRRNTVFGVGDTQADWLIVGEAPGESEDLQGEPFVGQDGKLLDNMLRALALDRRQKVYITNALKCRPPANRSAEPQQAAQCEPFLRRQVQLLKPRVILAMGRLAVQSLLQTTEPIGKLRGRVHQYEGIPVVVTFHPAYLLRNLPDKAKAWADLCLAQALVDGEASAAS